MLYMILWIIGCHICGLVMSVYLVTSAGASPSCCIPRMRRHRTAESRDACSKCTFPCSAHTLTHPSSTSKNIHITIEKYMSGLCIHVHSIFHLTDIAFNSKLIRTYVVMNCDVSVGGAGWVGVWLGWGGNMQYQYLDWWLWAVIYDVANWRAGWGYEPPRPPGPYRWFNCHVLSENQHQLSCLPTIS